MSLIEIRGLQKIYTSEGVATTALAGVSFDVEAGEFLAVMGPSGSGKSTLLHILGFLDRQSAGTYRFDGKAIDDYDDNQLAHVRNKRMGFVFQTFNLLPRNTVLENVKLPLYYSGIKESLWDGMAAEAVAAVELSHRSNYLTSKLSGGEKQRAAIARALVNNPSVIFADEPTGNLDSQSGQTIMEILDELNAEKGHTIVLITHETYTAEQAKRIVRIKDGKVESDEAVKQRRTSKEFVK